MQTYLKGSVDTKKPFLLEEGSRAHVNRINCLMKSSYDWSTIAMVAMLSSECDHLGSWAESCPCHDLPVPEKQKQRQRRKQNTANKEASECPLKCCRAPELAAGVGMQSLCKKMLTNKGPFTQVVSSCPPGQQTELITSWSTATSRLFGYLGKKRQCQSPISIWNINQSGVRSQSVGHISYIIGYYMSYISYDNNGCNLQLPSITNPCISILDFGRWTMRPLLALKHIRTDIDEACLLDRASLVALPGSQTTFRQ